MKWRILYHLAVLTLLAVLIKPVFAIWKAESETNIVREATRSALIGRAPLLASEDWRIVFDGQVGIVHGRLSSPECFGQAQAAIDEIHASAGSEVEGLTAIYSALSMEVAKPWVTIRQTKSNQIEVDGLLPAAVVYELMSTIRESFPANTIEVTNRIQFSEDVFSPEWGKPLAEYVPMFLRSVRNGEIRIERNCATLKGVASSNDLKNAVGDTINGKLSWAVNHIFNQIAAAPDSDTVLQSCVVLRSDTGNNEIVIEGTVSDQSTREVLMSQLEEAVSDTVPVKDQLVVDPRAPDVWWPYSMGDLFSEYVGNPWLKEIRIENNKVELNGRVVSVEERVRLESAVARQFPEPAFQVDSRLEVTPALFAQLAVLDVDALNLPLDTPTEDPEKLSALSDSIAATVIYFSKNSGYVRDSERIKLSPLADAINKTKHPKIVITGNTDSFGNAYRNEELSKQRASAVIEALAELGVEKSRMITRTSISGAGSPSEQRRVEFALLDLGESADEVMEVAEAAAPEVEPEIIQEPDTPVTEFVSASGDYSLAKLNLTAAATNVYFKRSSAMLESSYQRDLQGLAAVLKESPNGAIRISGFVAVSEKEETRAELAMWRCNVVARFLIDCGVAAERVEVVPEPQLVSEENSPSWKDHRVQFEALKWVAASDSSGWKTTAARSDESEPRRALAMDTTDAKALNDAIYFGSNSVSIRASEKLKLETKVAQLKEDNFARTLTIRGYTDKWGDPEYNRLLANRRSREVYQYLMSAGVPESRLNLEAAAEAGDELDGNGDRTASWKKRRVEFEWR